jgi:hypothetical protein
MANKPMPDPIPSVMLLKRCPIMKMIRLKRNNEKTNGFLVDKLLNIQSMSIAATEIFRLSLRIRSNSCCGSKFII